MKKNKKFSHEVGSMDEGLTGAKVQDIEKNKPRDSKSNFVADLMASIVNSVSNVPDSLATSIMAGVNPIHGLYATITGPTVAGFIQSSELMIVGTTVAASMLARGAIEGLPEESKLSSLFLIVILTGIFLIVFGLLKLGRLQKYISYSVMKGFLYGVGILLILSQSPAFFGYEAVEGNAIQVFWDTLTNINQWNFKALLIGVITLLIMLGLRKTKISSFSSAIALVVATLIGQMDYFSSISLVGDIANIPNQLPTIVFPNLSLISPDLIFSAFTMAILIAVQGLGVSQMSENPSGKPVDSSRDMVAQGASNIANGFIQGLPVGGSVGSTALNMTLGAKSRLTSILTGIWMIGIIWVLAEYVEMVPMSALTALILLAGAGAFNLKDTKSILRSGKTSLVTFSITLLCILLFNIPTAVGVGVILSILISTVTSANDVDITHLIKHEDGTIEEVEIPERVHERDPMVLEVIGNLNFAGAQSLIEEVPTFEGINKPVIILRMREQKQFGASLIEVFRDLAEDLAKEGGKLYLAELTPEQIEVFRRSRKLKEGHNIEFYERTSKIFEATNQALKDANKWVQM